MVGDRHRWDKTTEFWSHLEDFQFYCRLFPNILSSSASEEKQPFPTSIQQPIRTKRLQLGDGMNPASLHFCAIATALNRVMPLRWLEWD